MTPHEKDLTIYQGASFQRAWKLQDKDGDPVNLAGWSGVCHIREKVKDSEFLLEASTENGRLTIYEEDGYYFYGLNLAPQHTQILDIKKGVYDIKLEDVTGDKVRIQEGKVTVSPAVTRPWEAQ